jgi:hypothetical protein
MVEVDVAQQEMADIGERESAPREAPFKRGDCARRAAVEERRAIVGLEEVAADNALRAEVMKVNQAGDPAILAGSPAGRGLRGRGSSAPSHEHGSCGDEEQGGREEAEQVGTQRGSVG